MDLARALDEHGAPEGSVVVADEQTSGRGRSDHTWFSPPGQSIYLSAVLHPSLAPAQAGWVTMIAALAVLDTIHESARIVTNHSADLRDDSRIASIKWFNDVLMNQRKVCGILVEVSTVGEKLESMVVGIGLNVNTRFDAAPLDVQSRATSLAHELGHDLDREDVLQRLLAHLGARYERLMQTHTSPAAEYARHISTLGREVRINTGHEIITGRAVRIEDNGALIVQTPTREWRVGFGEVY